MMRDQNGKNQTKKDLNQESTTESSANLYSVILPYLPPPVCKEYHSDLNFLTIKEEARVSVLAGKFSSLMMTVHQKAQEVIPKEFLRWSITKPNFVIVIFVKQLVAVLLTKRFTKTGQNLYFLICGFVSGLTSIVVFPAYS